MKKALLLPALAAVTLLSTLNSHAEEPVSAFAQGLRNRGYFDTADEYLDRIANDPTIPAAVKKIIPYERAITISANAMSQRNADLKYQLLDKAATHLEEFIKNNPTHPKLGDAQSRRGKIKLDKARVASIEAQSPSNAGRRKELQAKALGYIKEARTIFTGARDTYQKEMDKFPKFISPEKTKEIAARKQAEVALMQAKINLAKTTYEEAQIYKPAGKKADPRYRSTLQQASEQFAKIHETHRTQIGGLYAQMWQGKCYEEQGEYGRALGIFNQLLDHPSKNRFYQDVIKPQALSFKLICLNDDPKREDYLIVEQSAEEWLKTNRRLHNRTPGLRIRFELARAREKLGIGASERTQVAPKERPRYLRLAKEDAEFVNRFQGRLKDVTTLMIVRIKRRLGIATEDPKDFPNAFSAANVTYKQFTSAHTDWAKAVKQGKPKAEVNKKFGKMKDDMQETVRLFKLALKLAKPNHNQDHVNDARHLLAYVLLRQAKVLNRPDLVYDAAVLAEFVGRHYKNQNPDTAQSSSYMALAAYIAMYNKAQSGKGKAKEEMRWIIGIAQHIIKSFPGSKQAIDSAFILGNIYNQQERWLLAARWYARIPPSAGRYADSLLNAGTNYWGHYSTAGAVEPTPENYRRELKAAAGENIAEAFAALLNPQYGEWQRVKRLDEVKQMLAASSGKVDAKTKVKVTAGAQAQITALQKKSEAKLIEEIKKLSKNPPPDLAKKPESELRSLLFTELDRKTRPELQKLFDDKLAAMKEDELKTVFQQRLEQWQSQAAWYLAKGVLVRQKGLPPKDPTPEDLTRAKVALAEYSISNGEYKRAVALLNAKPHDVMTAIEVKDGVERPKDNSLKSREFAAAIYQIRAQAFVGARELDNFKASMKKLEELVADTGTEEVTRIYTKLGRDLQKKIERLKNENDEERLKEERENFGWVVDALTEPGRQLSYNIWVWIGETSSAMGEGLGDPAEAKPFFEKASKAYQSALTANTSLKPEQKLAIQLRLINCLRRQQEYEKALTMVKGVIKQKPRLLPAQVEAAATLQGWARNKDSNKYIEAIVGDKIEGEKDTKIWGWQNLSEELKQVVRTYQNDIGKAATAAEKKAATAAWRDMWQQYLETRYTAFFCRAQLAAAQSDDPKKREVYKTAQREILAFATTVGVIKNDLRFEIPVETDKDGKKVLKKERVKVKEAFDKLYAEVQIGLGADASEVKKIDWAIEKPVIKKQQPPENPIGDPKTPAVGDTQKTGDNEPPKEPEGSSMLGMLFGILFLLAGLGGGGWFLFKSMGKDKGRNRRMAYAYSSEAPTFTEPTGQPAKASSGQTRKRRSREGDPARKKSSSGGTAKKRPAGSSTGKAPQPKRNPKKKPE